MAEGDTITIKLNPIPSRWVAYKLENNYHRSSPTVVKVLSPTSGFPAQRTGKGTGDPQEI